MAPRRTTKGHPVILLIGLEFAAGAAGGFALGWLARHYLPAILNQHPPDTGQL